MGKDAGLDGLVTNSKQIAVATPTTTGNETIDTMMVELDMTPLPGREHTMLAEEQWFGVSQVTGMPQDVFLRRMADDDLEMPKLSSPSTRHLKLLVTESRGLLEREDLPPLVEAARAKLEEERLIGHSITDSPTNHGGVMTDVGRLAYNLQMVSIVGLWPSQNSGGREPYIGNFGQQGNTLAGDHFRGFATVLISGREETKYVQYQNGERISKFIPPTEMVFIVPDEDIKEDLIDATRAHLGVDRGKLDKSQFESRVFTLQDVVDGKVTRESLQKFKETETAK
jgi:hypothetical protein